MQTRLMNGFDIIDVNFDFTTDTKGYWEVLKDKDLSLGGGVIDPDCNSGTLRTYHRILWSRELPNGEFMQLDDSGSISSTYLTWKGHRFGSDSIMHTLRYPEMHKIVKEYLSRYDDPRGFMESCIRTGYTIGGMIIFPKHRNSMNQDRGVNQRIRDRWDRTLECIRRYYAGEDSPLYRTCERDAWFYDLFVDFKGYVDFFFLQDCVSKDYSEVYSWMGDGMDDPPLPKDVETYSMWLDKNLEFVRKRNERIEKFVNRH